METRGNLLDMSERDRKAWAPYWKAVVGFTVMYQVCLFLALWLVPDEGPTTAQRFVMLLPVVPALGFVWGFKQFLGRLDEYGQLVQYKAMSVGFGVAITAAIAVGFVGLPGEANLFNELAPWIVFSAGMAAWGAAGAVQHVRNA